MFTTNESNDFSNKYLFGPHEMIKGAAPTEEDKKNLEIIFMCTCGI